MRIKTIQTSNKNLFSDVGMEKEQKQELGWRVSVLPIPAFHHCEPLCCMYTVYSGMQEWVIQIPSIPILVSVLFPSLHLKYFRIKFLLLVYYVLHVHSIQWNAGMGSTDTLHPNSCFCSPTSRKNFLLLVLYKDCMLCTFINVPYIISCVYI